MLLSPMCLRSLHGTLPVFGETPPGAGKPSCNRMLSGAQGNSYRSHCDSTSPEPVMPACSPAAQPEATAWTTHDLVDLFHMQIAMDVQISDVNALVP